LIGQDRAMLESVYGFLGTNTSGTPRYWFRSAPTVVTAYPLNTALSITVRYWKFAPDLSSGADVPLMPDRFREVIVEKACAYLFRDSNDVNAANDCLAAADRIIADMRAERFRQAIVERACATGLRYKGDWDGYRACMAEYDAAVQQMRGSMRLPPARQARTHYAVDD
jgi:hypothetical protein